MARIVSLLVKVDDALFNLVNIYAPTYPTERKEFLANLHRWGYLNSDSRAVCTRSETIAHCFIHCRRTRGCGVIFITPFMLSLFRTLFLILRMLSFMHGLGLLLRHTD